MSLFGKGLDLRKSTRKYVLTFECDAILGAHKGTNGCKYMNCGDLDLIEKIKDTSEKVYQRNMVGTTCITLLIPKGIIAKRKLHTTDWVKFTYESPWRTGKGVKGNAHVQYKEAIQMKDEDVLVRGDNVLNEAGGCNSKSR
jgi:hypothetical protein